MQLAKTTLLGSLALLAARGTTAPAHAQTITPIITVHGDGYWHRDGMIPSRFSTAIAVTFQ